MLFSLTSKARYLLAGNPDAPVQLLEEYAESLDAHIRARVAENPKTPLRLLIKFVNDAHQPRRQSGCNGNSAFSSCRGCASRRSLFSGRKSGGTVFGASKTACRRKPVHCLSRRENNGENRAFIHAKHIQIPGSIVT